MVILEFITGCFFVRETVDDSTVTYRDIKDSSCLYKLEYLERQIEQGDITRTELLNDIKELMKQKSKLEKLLQEKPKGKIVYKYKKSDVNIVNARDIDSLNQVINKLKVKDVSEKTGKTITKDKSKEKTDNSVKTKTSNGFWFGYLFGIGTVVILLLVYFYFKKK